MQLQGELMSKSPRQLQEVTDLRQTVGWCTPYSYPSRSPRLTNLDQRPGRFDRRIQRHLSLETANTAWRYHPRFGQALFSQQPTLTCNQAR